MSGARYFYNLTGYEGKWVVTVHKVTFGPCSDGCTMAHEHRHQVAFSTHDSLDEAMEELAGQYEFYGL